MLVQELEVHFVVVQDVGDNLVFAVAHEVVAVAALKGEHLDAVVPPAGGTGPSVGWNAPLDRVRQQLADSGNLSGVRSDLQKSKALDWLVEAEGADDLLIVAEALRQARAALDRITGRAGVEDMLEDRPALEQLAGSLDLGERVRFLGFVSEAEKLGLLRRAWGLCFASPKEGWGITNLEAAASGTPFFRASSGARLRADEPSSR